MIRGRGLFILQIGKMAEDIRNLPTVRRAVAGMG